MKVPYALTAIAAILFVALGVASLLLDLSIRSLRIGIGSQEQQVLSVEARNVELAAALQTQEERKERQELVNQMLRKEIVQKQTAVQMQQEQINQATTIAQQVAPNLLHDMAESSVKNEKMRQLLTKHGYTVQPK